MKTIEQEFLLTLLGFENYRAPLSKIKLYPTISDTEQEEICRQLYERGYLVCSYKISKFKIAAAGKFLLKQDSDQIPITKQERKVLKASAKDTITPKETGLPAKEQQAVIQGLAARGLIEVKTKRKKINEVWLTERGKEYLQYNYDPGETKSVLRAELLSNYIQFLRKAFQDVSPRSSMAVETQTISDDKILLTMVELERQLATDNRLPICYVRDKLHPLVLRDELDEVLYRLQQLDKIELSALQPGSACAFTSAQIDAGIPQESGPPLFFVSLK